MAVVATLPIAKLLPDAGNPIFSGGNVEIDGLRIIGVDWSRSSDRTIIGVLKPRFYGNGADDFGVIAID